MRSIRENLLNVFLLAALVYSVGTGIYSLVLKVQHYPPVKNDDAATWESRMVDVKASIPPDQKYVGYVSELMTLGYDKDRIQEYGFTQYSMAPTILVQSFEPEWIIGNSTDQSFEAWVDENIESEYTIQYFGNGLYVIHRGIP